MSMMRRIVGWSLQLRLLMVAAAAVLLFFGATELRQMPLDAVPEFSRPYVEVQTEALGLSAAEVEAMITVPLEADMLNGVPWADEIRSESIPGLSSIVIFFEPGTEMMTARQMVQERLVAVHALPNVSKPPAMLQPLSSTSRVLKIGMKSDRHSLIEQSVLARWTIVPRLMGVPGVANVSIWGQRQRQLQVQVDPARLRDEGVTLRQVISTTGNALWVSPLTFLDASNPGTGGWIETPNQRLGLLHRSPIQTAEDLARVNVEGTIKTLGDVANVVEDHQPLIGDAIVKDAPSLMLVVEKFPWASTTDVTRATEEAVTALQLGLPGIEMDTTLFRPATYLELARANIAGPLWIGAALAAVALFGLLGSWRKAAIALVAALSSGLAALTVLYLAGVTINLMIVAGLMIAAAVWIDDGVIDASHLARRLRESRQAGQAVAPAALIAAAAQGLRSPLVYATLIVLLVVAPVLLLEGVTGVFTRDIALSYALALLASMTVALTITPALGYLLLPAAARDDRESPLLEGLRGGLQGLLDRAARVPGTALLAGVAVLGVAALVGPLSLAPLGHSLLPRFQERDILVEYEAAPGTSEQNMRRIMSRAAGELRGIEGVRNVSAHLGRAILSDRVEDVDTGELWVSLTPEADFQPTLRSIRAAVKGYPGFDIDVDTYLTERIRDEATIDDPLVVRVYGEDLAVVREKAEEIARAIAEIAGVEDPEVEHPAEQPSVEIEVDLERAQHYGLKPGDVRRAVTTLLSGIEVGSLFEDQKVFDVVVWGTPEIRQNLNDLQGLLIDTPPPAGLGPDGRPHVLGGHVALKEVADVRVVPSPKVINRESVARHVDVTADVEDRSFLAVSAEVEERIRGLDFPLEYRAEVMGAYAARLATGRRLQLLAIGSALGILLLLQAAFGSWRLAFFFGLSLPLAAVGGVLATLAAGSFYTLGSVLGFVAVFGLAARQGMLLIRRCRELQAEGGGQDASDVARKGLAERFGPILTTAIVTAAALAPFALFGRVAGTEILQPMAVAILGGLVTTTLVTLGVVPSLYAGFGADAETLDLLAEEPREAA